MYKKFINCLNDMRFEYKELESIYFAKNFTVFNVVKVHNNFSDLYFEFSEDGYVYAWDSTGKLVHVISKKKDYIMIFELSWAVNNM